MTEYKKEVKLLEMDDRIEFSPNWIEEENIPLFTSVEETRFWRVDRAQVVSYDLVYYLNTDNKIDITLNEASGLVPTGNKTIYQIVFGIAQSGSGILLYTMWPQGKYTSQLQKVGMRPYTDKPKKRYIGCWSESESPRDNPRLIEWTLKDMNPINWRVYNDSANAQKVVLALRINKLHLQALGERREPIYPVYHYKDLNWG